MYQGSIHIRIAHTAVSIQNDTTTGTFPAEILMGKKLKIRLNFDSYSQIWNRKWLLAQQQHQKLDHDKGLRMCHFQEEEEVLVKNYSRGEMWLPGQISRILRPISMLQDSRMMQWHQDEVRKHQGTETSNTPFATGRRWRIRYTWRN